AESATGNDPLVWRTTRCAAEVHSRDRGNPQGPHRQWRVQPDQLGVSRSGDARVGVDLRPAPGRGRSHDESLATASADTLSSPARLRHQLAEQVDVHPLQKLEVLDPYTLVHL